MVNLRCGLLQMQNQPLFPVKITKKNCESISGLEGLEVIPWDKGNHPHEMHLWTMIEYTPTKVDYRLCKCPITFWDLKYAILMKTSIKQ